VLKQALKVSRIKFKDIDVRKYVSAQTLSPHWNLHGHSIESAETMIFKARKK